jgi:uroporphyrinogen-III synthase
MMKGNEFDGKIIGITRPEERVAEAVALVEEHGGKTLVAPTLELKISNSHSLVKMCQMAGELDWIIFTSPTGIISLFKHCENLKDRLKSNCKIAVIGPRTENYLEKKGLKADLIPDNFTAEGLLEVFKDIEITGKKIGIPKTLAARDTLPDGLKNMGAEIFIAEAYRSGLPENKDKVNELIKSIVNKKIDAVTFTSTLTVTNLLNMVKGKEKKDLLDVLKNGEVIVAAIGPVTAIPLHELGIDVLIPEKFTVKAMLEELMKKFN